MERPTVEVKLPISGIKAEVFTYYLRGERKQIEAIMLESAEWEPSKRGSPKLKSIDATYRSKMEDKAIMLAVKKLSGKDGKEIKVTIEVLDNLPDDDFEILQKALPARKAKKK